MNANGKNLAAISDAEWVVMKVFWAEGARTANQVVAALEGRSSWKPKTIHTLISRLVQKHVLRAEKQGREHLFTPLVSQEECRLAESKSFLDRVFDGELKPFLVSFLENEKLSEGELKEIEKLVKA